VSTPVLDGIAQGGTRVTLNAIQAAAEPAAAAATTIFVCMTCRRLQDAEDFPRPGATLARTAVAAALGSGVAVKRVRCLANCARGLSAAMRHPNSWTYMFGELNPDDGAALIDGALLLAQAQDGLMPWRGRPPALKRGLIARIPPIDIAEDTK
jgi:predicted metal-binding protein